jgi:hypothetical protein
MSRLGEMARGIVGDMEDIAIGTGNGPACGAGANGVSRVVLW